MNSYTGMSRFNKIFLNILFFLPGAVLISCGDSAVQNQRNETLVLQLDGEIESLGGDCSAVQVRTRNLGSLDFRNAQTVRFNLTGMTDADISSVGIFYVNNNSENVFLVDLPDRNAVNSTSSIEVNSPRTNTDLFLRVTLRSSVCTGQLFYLSVRDLRVYTVN